MTPILRENAARKSISLQSDSHISKFCVIPATHAAQSIIQTLKQRIRPVLSCYTAGSARGVGGLKFGELGRRKEGRGGGGGEGGGGVCGGCKV